MPSSSCVGMRVPDCPSVSAVAASASAEQDEDEKNKEPTFTMERTLKQLKLLDEKVSIACGGVGNRIRSTTSLGKRCLQKTANEKGDIDNEAAIANNSGGKDNNEHLWTRLLFGEGGLKWFVDALGGEEATKRMFANAYLNIQSISKPVEVAQAAAAAASSAHSSSSNPLSSKKNKCIPWALVRLAESEACICCHSAMQVPFKGFKRHKRNGVVFCFFGSRVFVTCMDEECATELKRRKQVRTIVVWVCIG